MSALSCAVAAVCAGACQPPLCMAATAGGRCARQPPLVGAVEALAEGRAGSPEFESYAVFDPKVSGEGAPLGCSTRQGVWM
eukprot:204583-Pelagomonas_calceolata.AAC.1